ncbi:MAG: nucleoside triphosphate pyrophosphohydrolase [Limnochordales bacterium]|nr:nucleoside triphosphate pyrophosphohydrolase [Limnochordales bacterium]
MAGVGDEMAKLVATMARLRGEGGCPWDKEQTHASLRPYVLEEAYEVADAIDRGDVEALREELGDLLLQVVFHAQLATEEGRFNLADIARELRLKLIRRHPHVFGEVEAEDAETVVRNWERIKQEEREKAGPFATLPRAMPALMRAEKVMKRAFALGFTGPGPEEAVQKVGEELDRVRELLRTAVREQQQQQQKQQQQLEEVIGDLLWAATTLARQVGVDPERALARATDRFIDRLSNPMLVRDEA